MKTVDAKHPIEFTVPASGVGSFYVQEDHRSNFYNHYHRHKEYQISYILKGRGSMLIGNLIQPFLEDEIYILKANDPHIFIKEGAEEEQIHAIHIFVAFDKLWSFFDLSELQPARDFFKNIDSSKKIEQDISLKIKAKFQELAKEEGIHKLMCILEVFQFLIAHEQDMHSLYSGLPESNFNDKVGVRINEVLRFSLANYDKEISIEEVSKLIHMTPSAFCKYFKKHTMKTYVTFLNEIRIEKACQLLINKATENISEVAYQCGFNTVVHFNRVFKSILNTSPTEFVNRHSAQALAK
ncbi:AraC family transcriptional regulator [Sphingobacterium humi]|uniref:Helix-turn-helix domain-containing protein n=1 Tax=Sphingobacterium humi TaxID=1796905 RepID=A0A6N8KZV5_9SPHI|nr:AraC family transcriptional regulator [Sphingobacterium humi]MVZ62616.1 helix-turn-helix domain-containing protein [Sphingobacterium humi]